MGFSWKQEIKNSRLKMKIRELNFKKKGMLQSADREKKKQERLDAS